MNNILDLSSSLDFNNSGVIKGEIEIDDIFELENNIEILVQDKIIEPTREIQTVTADEDYDQLGTVTVNPIPDEYIIPDGTLDVDANGDVDVTMFRMARVGVYTPPVLQDKLITIIENGTTNIVADEGYDGLGNIAVITDVQNDASTTSAMYLIENGIENRDITQGYTFEDFVAQVANANAVKQTDASFNMYSGLWARGNVTFNADFDFTRCKKMYIEYEFPATDLISSMRQYMDVTVRLLDQAGGTLTAVQIVGGRTVNRTTIEIPLDDINQVGKVFFSSSNLSGTNGAGNSSYSEAYPVRFFNVWFDVIDATPVLQDKIIDVTENGTIIVTPDSDYDGLNSVEVNVNVESSSSGEIPEKGFIVNEYNENGYAKKVTLFGYTTVPDFAFSGYTINSSTFYSMLVRDLEEVVLDDTITALGGYAFYGSPALQKINLDNITSIGTYALSDCKSLTLSDFPEKVTTLSWGAFNGSPVKFKNLKNLQGISNGGFSNCASLIQLSIPNLAYARDQGSSTAAFYKCTNLIAVWIGDKITNKSSISRCTFQGCTKLKKIFINLPRATVETFDNYSYAFMSDTSKVNIIVCNDDEGFMTQEEFDAIDWSNYTE